jgi:hypothetical protein
MFEGARWVCDLRMIEHVLDRAHRRAGDALAENLLPLEGAAHARDQLNPNLAGRRSWIARAQRVMKPGGRIALGFTGYSGRPNKGLSETLNAAGFEKARDRTFRQSSGSVSRTLPTPRMPALLARSMS